MWEEDRLKATGLSNHIKQKIKKRRYNFAQKYFITKQTYVADKAISLLEPF